MRYWILLLGGIALFAATACGGGGDNNERGAMNMGNGRSTMTAALATGTSTSPVGGARSVNVTLTEYGVQMDTDKIPAGPVRLVVRNAGQRGHELQVYPEPASTSGGHGMEMASGSMVDGAVGRLPLVPVGETRALDVTLSAGTWELGCHLADSENGMSFDHYDRGMKSMLTVRA